MSAEPRDDSWSPYYRAGVQAFREGKPHAACSYIPTAAGSTWHIEAWEQGWNNASKGVA